MIMKKSKPFTTVPLPFNRKVVIASVSVSSRRSAIHAITDVDVSLPRKLIRDHFEQTGEKWSFTAYIVACLAQTVKKNPKFNSFIRGNRLILLNDVTVSVLIERELEGDKTPEPLGIKKAQFKTFTEIHSEIRLAQQHTEKKLGSLAKTSWIRFIPGFLLRTFVKLADRNINMALRYGKVCVTSPGMFGKEALWFIPHGTATVMLTVGSISSKVVNIGGQFAEREHLNLTVSFDHNIIDGAPASRFIKQLTEELSHGRLIRDAQVLNKNTDVTIH